MSTHDTGPEAYAVDANLLLRTVVRGVCAVLLESTGKQLIIPATARVCAVEHYGRVSNNPILRRIEAENEERMAAGLRAATTEQIEQAWIERRARIGPTFDRWLGQRTASNEGTWRMGPRTEQTHRTALELATLGIVEDPKDQRYGTGEDAQVVAEALAAGAVLIASDNLDRIRNEALDEWLRKKKLQGWSKIRDPFIVGPDTVIKSLVEALATNAGVTSPYAAVVYETFTHKRPLSETERLKLTRKMIGHLQSGGCKLCAMRARRELEKLRTALGNQDGSIAHHLEDEAAGMGIDAAAHYRWEVRRLEEEEESARQIGITGASIKPVGDGTREGERR